MAKATSLLSRGSRVRISAGAPVLLADFIPRTVSRPHETARGRGERLHRVTLGLALLLLASTASAQELGLSRYKLPVVLLAGAATVDIGSTLMMAHYNQVHDPTFRSEKNPIVGWMEPRIGTPGMLAVGAAIEVTAMLVACKLLCEQHPKLMKWGLLTGAAVHGVTTTSNLRIHYGPH